MTNTASFKRNCTHGGKPGCKECKAEGRRFRVYGGYVMLDHCEACGSTDRLRVDHDHSCCDVSGGKRTCGKCVRGTLCYDCNELLKKWRTIKQLKGIIRYLRR